MRDDSVIQHQPPAVNVLLVKRANILRMEKTGVDKVLRNIHVYDFTDVC